MIVNGLGGMPLPELYIASGAARCQLGEAGIVIERSLVGSFATSLDMNGFSLTLSQLNDDRLELWDAPARTPALKT
jgi:dihydroxyacetone kinase-like protein